MGVTTPAENYNRQNDDQDRAFKEQSSDARRFNYFFAASRTASLKPPMAFCTFPWASFTLCLQLGVADNLADRFL